MSWYVNSDPAGLDSKAKRLYLSLAYMTGASFQPRRATIHENHKDIFD